MSIRFQLFVCLLVLAPAYAGTNNAIIVTAPRLDDLDLMAVEVASDVTVIDRDAIESSGATSVPELLQNEANVLFRSTTGNASSGELSMRGFGENSGLRVLVLVDGHKMNRSDMGAMEWQNIPVGNVERIEVIRGGQNVLYGNHALSGVVKVTTKKGGKPGVDLQGSVGSYGFRSGSAYASGSFKDSFFSVGIDHAWSDGYRSNSLSHSTGVNGSLGLYVGETDTLILRGAYADSHLQFPGPLTYEQMQDDPTQSKYSGSEHSDSKSGLATLIWETERDWGAARIASGVNVRDMDWQLGGIYANNRQVGISFAPRVRYGTVDDYFMTGFDSFYDSLDFENYHPDDTDYTQSWAELDRLTVSPYLFSQRSFEKGFILNGGVRYEHAQTDNTYVDYVDDQILPTIDLLGLGTIPNPNYKSPPDVDATNSYDGVISKQGWAAEVSLAYTLTKQWSVWTGYDRVYRYPTLDETASYQGFPLSDPLNENLDPEQGHNAEVGTRYSNSRWLGSLTAFCLMMDNEIAYVERPGVRLNMNIGETRRLGTEAEVAYSGDWYGASTRWTFVDARLENGENKGNQIPLVPWAYGSSSVWVQPLKPLRITASYTYVAEQFQGGDEANVLREMDPYGLLGLRLNIKISERTDLVLSGQNLLDETYASSAYGGLFYPGSGRSFRMGITLGF